MLPERRSVLLVDDDADDRFLVEQAWREAGILNPLSCVDNGRGALELFSNAGAMPAFVLLDIKMPGMSGFEVLKKLREDDRTRRIPVIIFTASTSPSDVAEAYRLGANAFFIKPSSVRELVELLEALKRCWLRFNEFPEPRP